MQHRLSNKDRPMSPEQLSSAFPESVRAAEGDKEVVAFQQPQPLPYQRPIDGAGREGGRRVMGMRAKWFYGLLVVLVLLAVGLGIGLGVGLGTRGDGYVDSNSYLLVEAFEMGFLWFGYDKIVTDVN